MEFVEKHLTKIKEILNSTSGLFVKLDEISEYLVETNDLACLSIFRRTGDELDDTVITTNRKAQAESYEQKKIHILSANVKKQVTIIPSKFIKTRSVSSAYKARPEFLIPIKFEENVVGFLHAEKNSGAFFAPTEVRLLKECAKELSNYFHPTVFSIPQTG
ncbi:MAG: hypothetical protein DWQ05_15145 [Calditrichaeota bacterium]|nr:MAG: hypothetical protein DWQ05_15145 [Calditrichota bacterium]